MAPVGAGTEPVQINQHLENLEVGATYHFRVVAENKWGEVASDDQTFAFFTANCPNAHVRQQTGAAYLPDCRAYELVSPRNAGAVQLFPGQGLGGRSSAKTSSPSASPNTGLATDPSRFAFWGGIGQIDRHRPAEHHPGPLRLDPHPDRLGNALSRRRRVGNTRSPAEPNAAATWTCASTTTSKTRSNSSSMTKARTRPTSSTRTKTAHRRALPDHRRSRRRRRIRRRRHALGRLHPLRVLLERCRLRRQAASKSAPGSAYDNDAPRTPRR